MMRSLLLFLFFCQVIAFSWAYQPMGNTPVKTKDTLTVRMDSATVRARAFEAKAFTRYQQDSAFDYREEVAPVNWWQQFKQWFYQRLAKLFVNKNSAAAFKWLFILIGVAALLLLIYKLSGMSLMGIFSRKAGTIDKSSFEETEDIHIIDFDDEIKKAIERAHFRQAVRLLYLQSLKDLTDKQLIDWQPGKTNRTYLQELEAKSLKKDFASLTGQFEYIWYGGFPIDEDDFLSLQHQFISFKQFIH